MTHRMQSGGGEVPVQEGICERFLDGGSPVSWFDELAKVVRIIETRVPIIRTVVGRLREGLGVVKRLVKRGWVRERLACDPVFEPRP